MENKCSLVYARALSAHNIQKTILLSFWCFKSKYITKYVPQNYHIEVQHAFKIRPINERIILPCGRWENEEKWCQRCDAMQKR